MIDDDITLKKLQIFLSFMRCKTLKATAEQFGVSGVSIHKALHSLEEGLRCPLFEHQGRNLIPLSSAETLQIRCEAIFNDLNLAIRQTQESGGVFSDSLNLGSLYSLTFDMVPKILTGLRTRKPTINVSLSQGSNEFLFQQLDKMIFDVILVSMESDKPIPGYVILPIYQDEMMVVVSKSSRFSLREDIGLEELTNDPLITLKPGFATYLDCNRSFKRAQVEPTVTMQVGDIFTLLSMVESNIGYSVVPSRVKDKFNPNITFIKIRHGYGVKQIVSMICLESKERDPSVLACIAECRLYSLEKQRLSMGYKAA